MSQPGAGVRREREVIRRKLAKLCPPHPDDRIVQYDSERGQIPRRVCTRCWATLPCQGCGRTHIDQAGDDCPLEHCEATRPW